MSDSEVIVVHCSCPDRETASKLAHGLIAARLAACVQQLPEIRSVYEWQGKLCEDAESLLLVKTTAARLEALTAWLTREHPYEEPEILALPAAGGSQSFLQWVADTVALPPLEN